MKELADLGLLGVQKYREGNYPLSKIYLRVAAEKMLELTRVFYTYS